MKIVIDDNGITIVPSNTIELESFSINILESRTYYDRTTDPKWIAFCKKHHLHYIKDAYNKFYDIYLKYCIEGLI